MDVLTVKVMKNSCINRSDAEDHDSGGLACLIAMWNCGVLGGGYRRTTVINFVCRKL